MKCTDRIDYIDIFRGLGIILMVMGHIGFGYHFDYFIHAFHMPMFFFVSGFLYKSKNITFKKFALKKAKSLLIPYFMFGIFHYTIWILLNGFSVRPLFHLLFINTEELPIAGALWFLTALFFADLIYFLIDKYISNYVVRWILIIVISLTGTLVNKVMHITLPYALSAAMVGTGLMHIGYQIKLHKNRKIIMKLLDMKFFCWIILSILTVILIFVNGYVNMRTENYAIIPLFWINAVLATLIGFNASKFFNNLFKESKIISIIKDIGCNSITYVCLNQIILLTIQVCIVRIEIL